MARALLLAFAVLGFAWVGESSSATGRGFALELFLGSHAVYGSSSFYNHSAFSISTWVKSYNNGLLWGTLLGDSRWDTNTGAALMVSYGSIVFLAGSNFYSTNKSLTIPINMYQWYHAVATWNESDRGGTGRIYVNGQLEAEASNLGACTVKAAASLYIGRMLDSGMDMRFSGQLDEIALWDKVLTPAEVRALYLGPPMTGSEAGLLMGYAADADNKTHVLDLSPYARHALKVEGKEAVTAASTLLLVPCVVSYRPDCFAERNTTGGREAWCTPLQNLSTCGDYAVTGSEECDSGSGCDSCECPSGLRSRDLNCSNASAPRCDTWKASSDCLGTLMGAESCEELLDDGLRCIINISCTVFDFPIQALELYVQKCYTQCGSNRSCFDFAPERCMFNVTQADCEAHGCSWCGNYCQQHAIDCKPMCGNGIVDYGEVCDNGRIDGTQGCWANCEGLDDGWNCTGSVCNTTCGDGIVVSSTEACDLGSLNGLNSGCTSACTVKDGFSCSSNNGVSSCTCVHNCASNSGLSTAAIAGIAAGGGGCLLISAGLIVVALATPVRRQVKKRLLSRSNSVRLNSIFRPPCSMRSDFDYTGSTFVSLDIVPFTINPLSLDFNKGKNEMCPINTLVRCSLTIAKSKKLLFWRIIPDRSLKYEIAFLPESGMLSPDMEAHVVGEIKVICTSNITSKIAIVFSDQPIDEQVDMSLVKHTFLNMHIQTMRSASIDPDEIQIIRPAIGDGATGTVYKGSFFGQEVAVKVLKFQDLGERSKDFEREVALLEGLRCAFAVQFFGSVNIPGQLCLVTEFLPLGDLGKAIRNRNLGFDFKIRAAYDCARGMAYLHSCRIMHRDLKPDNLLVASFSISSPVVCKLTDFGTTREVGEATQHNFTKGIGTPIYMSPEILSGSLYDFSADVYSFAVLMYELYIEDDPYPVSKFKHSWDVCDFVIKGSRLEIPSECPKSYSDIIEDCWSHTPLARPDFPTIVTRIRPLLPVNVDTPTGTATDLLSVQKMTSTFDGSAFSMGSSSLNRTSKTV